MSAYHQDPFLLDARGVIHVGASFGQERELYQSLGLPVVWVEPIPEVFAQLRQNIATFHRQIAVQALLTDRDGVEYTFHISNNEGMSSSILELDLHRDIWPDVDYTHEIQLISKTLPALLIENAVDPAAYDALVMDTQGSELLILQGATPVLHHFRYIKTEAPDFESYRGCCLVSDLAQFLDGHGFDEHARHKFAERKQGGSYYDVVFARRAQL
jgi:FkbM family methyltransferase